MSVSLLVRLLHQESVHTLDSVLFWTSVCGNQFSSCPIPALDFLIGENSCSWILGLVLELPTLIFLIFIVLLWWFYGHTHKLFDEISARL
jgi:hypothetical protein